MYWMQGLNMRLTKQQKIYGAVLGLLLAGLAVDRFLLGEAAVPAASVAAAIVAPVPSPSVVAAADEAAGLDLVPASGRPVTRAIGATLTKRLEQLTLDQGLEDGDFEDAFRVQFKWLGESADAKMPVLADPVIVPSRSDRFVANHRLTAVLGSDDQGLAMINDTAVRTGDEVDGFVLVAVHKRSAILVSEGLQIELVLESLND